MKITVKENRKLIVVNNQNTQNGDIFKGGNYYTHITVKAVD